MEPIEVLKEMIELQRIDTGSDELEKLKKNFLRDIEAINGNLSILKIQLQNEKKALEELVKSRKALELEIGTLDSKIAKYMGQQNDVKSNDQVLALGQEIDKAKADKAIAEEKALELLMSEDEGKAKVLATADKLGDEEVSAAANKVTLNEKIADCDKNLVDKKQERAQQLPKIEEEFARGYESIRKTKKIAVAAVIEDNICGGCNMNVSPQVLHDIRKKMAIQRCQCGRYLYIKD